MGRETCEDSAWTWITHLWRLAFFFLFLLLFFFFLVFHWPLRDISAVALPWLWHTSPKSSATHCYQCVQCFPVSRQWYGCQCLGFLTWTRMLMRAIAHGGCTDTVRVCTESWLSGRKNPCRTGNSNPRQYYAWFSDQCSNNWAVLAPSLSPVFEESRATLN